MILDHHVLLRTLTLIVLVVMVMVMMIVVMFCKDNLNWKYRAVGRPKLSGPPGDRDY